VRFRLPRLKEFPKGTTLAAYGLALLLFIYVPLAALQERLPPDADKRPFHVLLNPPAEEAAKLGLAMFCIGVFLPRVSARRHLHVAAMLVLLCTLPMLSHEVQQKPGLLPVLAVAHPTWSLIGLVIWQLRPSHWFLTSVGAHAVFNLLGDYGPPAEKFALQMMLLLVLLSVVVFRLVHWPPRAPH
jgi:hypothetical protein